MRINENIAISTEKILLVPYSKHHVVTYHEWMKSPTLQQATASEPLTLEQEYDMQRSWRRDGDKLTFIACLPSRQVSSRKEGGLVVQGAHEATDGPERMIGDVNLFVNEVDDEGVEGNCLGEVEIMVARTEMQGQGVGTAILLAFLWYILAHLDAIVGEYAQSLGETGKVMTHLRVKIDAENKRSIRLFEKAGFKKTTQEPNYFNELELRYAIPAGREARAVAEQLDIDEPKIALYQLV